MDYRYDSLQFTNKYIARDIAKNKFIDPRKFLKAKDPLRIERDPFNIGKDTNRITHKENLNEPDGRQLLQLTQKKRKEKATIINIDSRDRNIQNINIISNERFITTSSAICTTAGSFNITINDPNHGLKNNSKITLNNLDLGSISYNLSMSVIKEEGKNICLIINHPNHGLQNLDGIEQIEISNVLVDITPGTSIVKEEIYPPPFPPNRDLIIGTNNEYINGDTLIAFNNQGLQFNFVVINDVPFCPVIRVKPTDTPIFVFTGTKSLFFRRININKINKKHIIDVIDSNNYKIVLDVISPEPYTTTDLNQFTVSFLTLNGIPKQNIVASYPTSTERLNGNHKIRVIDNNNYIIRVQKSAYKDGCLDLKDSKGFTIQPNIKIGQVERIIQGYPRPNKYIIPLNRTFYNIYKIRLISSEFPNSQKVVRDNVNNKLLWQNELDGNIIYSVEIDRGNYDVDSLITELQNKISNTPRDNLNINNNMKININTETSNVDFFNLESRNLDTDPILVAEGSNILVVNQINHGFDNDDFVILNNVPSLAGIPADKINDIQFLVTFLTLDYFQITLDVNAKSDVGNIDFELNGDVDISTLSGGGGGDGIISNKVLRMRLLHQDPTTIGQILGFNGAGQPDYFLPDFNENVNNQTYNLLNNSNQIGNINLRGDNYFFMVSSQFGQMQNSGKVINIFAKLVLIQDPGLLNYDTYVGGISVFDEPIARLDFLEFEFTNPDTTLYDFSQTDHSYTIEITELVEIASDTSYSSRGGHKAFRDDRETQVNRTRFK